MAILFGGTAFLERPALAAEPVAPAVSWTGCYVGGSLGGGWGTRNIANPAGFITPQNPAFPYLNDTPFGVNSLYQRVTASGFVGSVQTGCGDQIAPNWVVGLEGEFSSTQLSGDHQVSLTPVPFFSFAVPANLHVETDWIADATGMLGYSRPVVLRQGRRSLDPQPI
jgi:outer membrane immunogenic protein